MNFFRAEKLNIGISQWPCPGHVLLTIDVTALVQIVEGHFLHLHYANDTVTAIDDCGGREQLGEFQFFHGE